MKQNEKNTDPERRSTLQNFGHTPNNRKILSGKCFAHMERGLCGR